jgi:hypothetical protein
MNCGGCQYFAAEISRPNWGYCSVIDDVNASHHPLGDDVRAYVYDTHDRGTGAIAVRRDFGCVLYVARTKAMDNAGDADLI